MPKSEAAPSRRLGVPDSALRLLRLNRRDPRHIARLVVGTLVALNLVAALVVFKPWGGSPEDLARQMEDLRRQVLIRQTSLARARSLAAKVEKARVEGDQFLGQYVMTRRTASSTIVSELSQLAKQAGIKTKEAAFAFEPIEGSETLTMMTVAAGYEGTYQNLTRFINLLDRSPRFLIIESLQASPQQTGAMLNVMLKFNAFVRDEAGHALQQASTAAPAMAVASSQGAPQP